MKIIRCLALILALMLTLTGCERVLESPVLDSGAKSTAGELPPEAERDAEEGLFEDSSKPSSGEESTLPAEPITAETLPAYTGEPSVAVNGNQPQFEDFTTKVFETYSGLDALGRCGVAFANVCPELMPKEERGAIGSVKPSGWQSVKYDSVDGKFLYNRCHLIGYQLTGENSNVCNLITGTRSLNIEGMLPYENRVADYVRETGNHVLYRVTPVFVGEELLCRGVQMEAWSVEDQGEGVCFNVWCPNAQPGISIDYATGDSVLTEQAEEEAQTGYILNVGHKKFHKPDCPSVEQMSPKNRKTSRRTRKELIADGWAPCGRCRP